MEDASRVKLWNHLMQAVSFYQGASPFGIVGSTLLDREEKQNRFFQYKHQFLVHTLEDQVLMDILSAIHQKKLFPLKTTATEADSPSLTGCPPENLCQHTHWAPLSVPVSHIKTALSKCAP